MKRLSLNPFVLGLVSVVTTPSAFGQGTFVPSPEIGKAIKKATMKPLDHLIEATERNRTSLDSDSAVSFGINVKFEGKDLVAHGSIPKVCATHLEFNPQVERVQNSESFELNSADDVASIASQVKANFAFLGVPQVKTYIDCVREAGKDAEKVELSLLPEFRKTILESADEAALVQLSKNSVKSAGFIKLEAQYQALNCKDCASDPAKAIAMILNTTDARLSGSLEKLALSPVESLIEQAVLANTEAELIQIRTALLNYAEKISGTGLKVETQIQVRKLVFSALTEVLPTRAFELGSANEVYAGESSDSKASIWSDVRVSTRTKSVLPSPERYLKFVSQTLNLASRMSGVDREEAKNFKDLSRQLLVQGSEVRVRRLAQMQPYHPEVGQSLAQGQIISHRLKQQFYMQCGRGLNSHNFTMCGKLSEEIQAKDRFIQSVGPMYQSALAQASGYGSSQYNGTPAIPSLATPPIAGNFSQPNGNFTAQNAFRPNGYQGLQFDQMYQTQLNPHASLFNQPFMQSAGAQGFSNQPLANSGFNLPMAAPLSANPVRS